MIIFPAVDLFEGRAVRLYKGDYQQMTVYSDDPAGTARSFRAAGAEHLHVVDLEGARDGTTANLPTIQKIIGESGLKVEIGGGIRTEDVIKRYIDLGAERVILGTAAVTTPGFVGEMAVRYGNKIAVGVDMKDGFVAIKGWTEVTKKDGLAFCREMQALGVQTVICTDISKDGVLGGTNFALYKRLAEELSMDIVASGGVSTLGDVEALCKMKLFGAILGKAVYTGDIRLSDAVALSRRYEEDRI